jgi:CheY-like chemotaxis protein
VILGGAEAIAEFVESGATVDARDVEDIQRAARQATAIARQLLRFGEKRISAPEVVEIDARLRATQTLLQRVLGEEIDLVITSHARRAIRIDPADLEQLLVNLAVNARDAMPTGGKLAIGTEDRPDAEVALIVSDTGVGMSEQTQAHLFEPFFTTKGEPRGTGLGLATVYGLVRQAGGKIRVDSRLGSGTSFEITFPAVHGAAATAAKRHLPGRRRTGRILLIEPDAGVRRLIAKHLEEAGYVVFDAFGAGPALEIAAAHTIDLVIADPETEGREIGIEVQKLQPEARVLVISGRTDGEPLTKVSLLARVRQLLAQPKPAS